MTAQVQPSALDAAAFARLTEAEAESFLAARYCALTEAGFPPVQALATAKRTEVVILVSTDSRVRAA